MRARLIYMVPALWCLATPSLAAGPMVEGLHAPLPQLVLIRGNFTVDGSANALYHLIPPQSR
jgi:hypothetical protein